MALILSRLEPLSSPQKGLFIKMDVLIILNRYPFHDLCTRSVSLLVTFSTLLSPLFYLCSKNFSNSNRPDPLSLSFLRLSYIQS